MLLKKNCVIGIIQPGIIFRLKNCVIGTIEFGMMKQDII